MFVKKVVLEEIELAELLMRDICTSWCRETRISDVVLGKKGVGFTHMINGRRIYAECGVWNQQNISTCQFYEQ
jgi:hypothetical protein